MCDNPENFYISLEGSLYELETSSQSIEWPPNSPD